MIVRCPFSGPNLVGDIHVSRRIIWKRYCIKRDQLSVYKSEMICFRVHEDI